MDKKLKVIKESRKYGTPLNSGDIQWLIETIDELVAENHRLKREITNLHRGIERNKKKEREKN